MAMLGVDSGSLYRRTRSPSGLAWSWVGGRLAPFYIRQMNRWTLAMALPWWQHHKHCLRYYYYYYYYYYYLAWKLILILSSHEGQKAESTYALQRGLQPVPKAVYRSAFCHKHVNARCPPCDPFQTVGANYLKDIFSLNYGRELWTIKEKWLDECKRTTGI